MSNPPKGHCPPTSTPSSPPSRTRVPLHIFFGFSATVDCCGTSCYGARSVGGDGTMTGASAGVGTETNEDSKFGANGVLYCDGVSGGT